MRKTLDVHGLVSGLGRTLLCVAVVLPVATPRTARAQRVNADRARQATDAFKSCREQQKLGDATACYKLWVQKWKDVGNEGEVAYSEEHAVAPVAAPATATAEARASGAVLPTVADSATSFLSIVNVPERTVIEIDGEVRSTSAIAKLELSPGEHVARVTDEHGVATRHRVLVKSGETAVLDLARGAGTPTAAPAPSPADGTPRAGLATGAILDFCALKPKANTGKFEKQRVVLFAASQSDQLEDDAKVRAAHGGTVFREVFAGRFPLQRFHNVAAHASAPKGWESRESIPLTELVALEAPTDPSADDATKKRAASENEFVRYSLACADYVALPAVTTHTAKWEEQQVKDSKGQTRTVKTLKLEVSGALGIFKRDGTSFRRVAQLNAAVPSFVDLATDTAAMSAAAASSSVKIGNMDLVGMASTTRELPKFVSAVPDPSCVFTKAATDGVAGLASCGPKGDGSTEAALGALDERLGPVCRKALGGGDASGDGEALIAECEVRARAFQLSRALQKDARGVEGWRLFGILAAKQGAPAFALGHAEGIRVGYAFQAVTNGERVGFYKVTDLGPGGEEGDGARTTLAKRSGDAPEGSRLEEWAQTGILIQPFATAGLLTFNSRTTVLRKGNDSVLFELPSAVVGGGMSVGYDLSSALSWSESSVRVSASAAVGYGTGTRAILIPVEAYFEKGFYLGPRLTFTGALGGGVQFVNLRFNKSGILNDDLEASAMVFGPTARVGAGFMLHPDWSLDVNLAARVGVSRASYSSDGDQAPLAEIQRRDDHYGTLAANLGVTRTF